MELAKNRVHNDSNHFTFMKADGREACWRVKAQEVALKTLKKCKVGAATYLSCRPARGEPDGVTCLNTLAAPPPMTFPFLHRPGKIKQHLPV
jgi:hypothetical protein